MDAPITAASRTTDDNERSAEIKSSGSQDGHKIWHIGRTMGFIDYYYLVSDVDAKSFSRSTR